MFHSDLKRPCTPTGESEAMALKLRIQSGQIDLEPLALHLTLQPSVAIKKVSGPQAYSAFFFFFEAENGV